MSYLTDLRAQGLDIASRDEWGSTYNYSDPRTVTIPALYLFLHIAVVEDPGDLVGSEHQVMRNIERIGAARFPNTGISYNAASFDTGRLYDGQPLTRRGAHTVNVLGTPGFVGGPADNSNLNYTARALVLPQQVTDDVTDAQIDSAARWAAACIRIGQVVKGARWFGHRQVAPKDCPGSKAYALLPELQALTDRYVAEGLDMAIDDADVDKIWNKKLQKPGTEGEENQLTAGGMLRTNYGNIVNVQARLGAVEGNQALILQTIQSGGQFTLEQITQAAHDGAEQALAEGVDIKVTVDDQDAPA